MAEDAGDDRNQGEDEPARVGQSKGKSSEVEHPRMIQGVVGAGSSTAGYAGTEGRSVEVEPAKRDQDRGDLFLSFGGYDGYKLARILYRRLTAFGVRVLKDCGTLRASEELLLSIHSSKIYIPIISASYARSSRCLNALALMIEQASESKGKIEVLPVFYDIVRSDVQLASIYREALDMHRRRRGPDQVKRWQNALVEAANVDGWERSSYKGYDTSSVFFSCGIL